MPTLPVLARGGLAAAAFLGLAAPADAATLYSSLSDWQTALGASAETWALAIMGVAAVGAGLRQRRQRAGANPSR